MMSENDTEHDLQKDSIEQLAQVLADGLDRRKTTVMENHAQTIIVFVILAVLSWVGYSILQTGKEFTNTNIAIGIIKNDMAHMKTTLDKAASNYVTITEYRITNNAMQTDIAEVKAQVKQLESKPGK
jgi:predicted negative regulator of RcsB-dependent stress response